MATTLVTLTSAWQSLGDGPVSVQMHSGIGAELHIASSAPLANEEAVHQIGLGSPHPAGIDYGGTENVYARTLSETVTTKVVYTPIL